MVEGPQRESETFALPNMKYLVLELGYDESHFLVFRMPFSKEKSVYSLFIDGQAWIVSDKLDNIKQHLVDQINRLE